MPSKKTQPTLPEKLRKLAGEIEAVMRPRGPKTPEEMQAHVEEDLRTRGFSRRLFAQRKAAAGETSGDETDGGNDEDGAPTSPPLPPPPRKLRSRR